MPGILDLAAEVEHWFGPMVAHFGFRSALDKHIRLSKALVAVPGAQGARSAGSVAGTEGTEGMEVLGGLLFGGRAPIHHTHWLVVAEQERGRGVGRALLAEATRRFVRGPGSIEVITFGVDHPGAVASGARVFYERLGFSPAEAAAPGPEGGSRQVYRRAVTG